MELTMLTVTVDGVGAGVEVGVGAAVDDKPPPPQLTSRSAAAMATPVPDRRGVFMPVHRATGMPDATSVATTTCVILNYRGGKIFRRSSGRPTRESGRAFPVRQTGAEAGEVVIEADKSRPPILLTQIGRF